MARQERTARASKRAAEKVADTLAEHQANLYAHRSTQKRLPEDHPRKAAQTDPKPKKAPLAGARTRTAPAPASVGSGAALAAEVRRLRVDEGLSWMQVGAKLGLPGSKNGAATARKLYAEHFGDYRDTNQHRAARQPSVSAEERAERKRERAASRRAATPNKAEIKERVRSGADHVIPLDTPDEELWAQLKGRTIKWSVDVGRLTGQPGKGPWLEEEAIVHPDGFEVERYGEADPDPRIHFRVGEWTRESGLLATVFRTVRLACVHEVAG